MRLVINLRETDRIYIPKPDVPFFVELELRYPRAEGFYCVWHYKKKGLPSSSLPILRLKRPPYAGPLNPLKSSPCFWGAFDLSNGDETSWNYLWLFTKSSAAKSLALTAACTDGFAELSKPFPLVVA